MAEKINEKCIWSQDFTKDGDTKYYTSCGNSHETINIIEHYKNYKYCPSCAKEIKVKIVDCICYLCVKKSVATGETEIDCACDTSSDCYIPERCDKCDVKDHCDIYLTKQT